MQIGACLSHFLECIRAGVTASASRWDLREPGEFKTRAHPRLNLFESAKSQAGISRYVVAIS